MSERLKGILRQAENATKVIASLCNATFPLPKEVEDAIDDAVCDFVVAMSQYGDVRSHDGEPIGFMWASNDKAPDGMSPGDTKTDPRTGEMFRLIEINKGMRLVYGWVPYAT